MAQSLEGAYTLPKGPAYPSLRLKTALPACREPVGFYS